MPLPADLQGDWPVISQLLDEALTLPPAQRDAFLDGLPAEHAPLRATLRGLLAQADGVETGEFLATLPRFTRVAARGPLTELAAGESIGPYRLISELGAGGMGAVWLAERADGALKRKVALKLPRLVWAKGLAERMTRERDILATLEHPNIARLYDAGVDQHGRPYLALEYVEGQPIDAYAKERGLSVKDKLHLLLQVCSAVAFAHSRLVVHRDLKPSNILVTADGQVRLLDFGIAKLMEGDSAKETQLTQLAGRALTLDYASPEQIKGEPIGTASDVYSLGVVAYELLTGARPYRLKRGSLAELEEAVAAAEPAWASEAAQHRVDAKQLRGDLDAILNRCLKKAVPDRYASVDALREDFQRYLRGQPVQARPDGRFYRVLRWARRNRAAVLIGFGVCLALLASAYAQAAVMLALAAGAAIAYTQRADALRQAELARREAAEARSQRERAERVKSFALGLFENANVEGGASINTSAVDLLRKAVELQTTDEGDAATAVELRLAIARAFLGLGAHKEAADLLQAGQQVVARLPRGHAMALQSQLFLAEAVIGAGETSRGLDLIDELLPRLKGKADLLCSALREKSIGLYRRGQAKEALQSAQEAVRAGELGATTKTLLKALNEQTRTMTYVFAGGRLESARRAIDLTEQCDPQRDWLDIQVARELFASANCFEGDAKLGLEEYRRIVESLEERLGPWHERVAAALNTMAGAQHQCGDHAGARASLSRCLAIEEKTRGPNTQNMRIGRHGLGTTLANEGRFEEALNLLRAGCEDFVKHEGQEHLLTRIAYDRLAGALLRAGELEEAEEILSRQDNGEARNGINFLQDKALLLTLKGEPHRAVALLEPQREEFMNAPMLHTRAVAASTLGEAMVEAQMFEKSLGPLTMALEIFTGRHPYGSSALARVNVLLGRSQLALNATETARAHLESACKYWEGTQPRVTPAAEAAGWLALAVAGADRKRAREYALWAEPLLSCSSISAHRRLASRLQVEVLAP